MKSTIKIALGEQNNPVIRFNIINTDDLRDQLCRQFMTDLKGTSNLCFFGIEEFSILPDKDHLHQVVISPIPGGREYEFVNRLTVEQQQSLSTALGVLTVDEGKLPSKHQVDDEVTTDDIFDGQIVGVRFTIGKVYYDILDKLSGKVIRDVDSACITEPIIKVPTTSTI